MQTLKSYIPKTIKSFFKDLVSGLTPEQELILKAQESLNKPPSVLFFTTHKCASTFIPSLLKTMTKYSSYQFKNYEGAIWNLGNRIDIDSSQRQLINDLVQNASDRLFFLKGEIYAPLRFPIDFQNRHQFKHIFFLRDPRDVLVSSYYSFGFTHGLPKNSKLKNDLQLRKKSIQQQGIDNYVMSVADSCLDRYLKYRYLLENTDSYLYLKYSDFQNNTADFIKKVASHLNITIPEKEVEELVVYACPVQTKQDKSKHKRSGKSNQYLEELKPETLNILNNKFSEILDYWNFN